MMNNKVCQATEIKPRNIGKRPVVTGNTTHVEYFEELMHDRINMSPLPKIKSLNTIIRFEIMGHNAGCWTIAVEEGILKHISRNHFDSSPFKGKNVESLKSQRDNSELLSRDITLKPMCIFRLEGQTFMSIVRREITPQQAFFQKKVQIEGDMTIALKMNVLVNYL